MPAHRLRQLPLALAFAVASAPAWCQTQAWPTKPIRLICPFPPAGAVDITSRAIAQELSRQIGQPVPVENRPGAGGNLGGEIAAKAPGDGYTLFMTTSPIQAINPALYSKMPFDPNRDFAFVSVLVSLNNLLVVHPSLPTRSVKELTALAKAHPGKLAYASSGIGTSIHLSAVLYQVLTGAQMTHVPYKGSAPALTDLMGGQVQVMFDNLPSAAPHVKGGKLRALGVTGTKRSGSFPEVPTMAEAGVTGYEATTWFGLSTPVNTPKDIVARMAAEAVKGAQSREFRERMEGLGFEVIGSSPERMAEMVRTEIDRWGPVIRQAGVRLE